MKRKAVKTATIPKEKPTVFLRIRKAFLKAIEAES